MAPCEFYFNLTLGFGGSRFYTKFIPGITTGVKFPLTSKLRCLNWLDFRGRFKLRKVRRGNLRVKSDTIGPLAQIQSSTFHSNVQRAFFSLGGKKYLKFLKKVLSRVPGWLHPDNPVKCGEKTRANLSQTQTPPSAMRESAMFENKCRRTYLLSDN